MKNPIRRSRNIGKTQGGRVKGGRAYEKWNRSGYLHNIYAQLSDSNDTWQLFKDNPSKSYFHPCEGGEYFNVLRKLPGELTKYVKAIILPRMSKYDERYAVEAKRRYDCIIMNPFPKNMKVVWSYKPVKAVFRHYEPWCNHWKNIGKSWVLLWEYDEVRRYYLYHLFLHELGHISQPRFHSLNRREEFAENFALEWARHLGKLA